MKETTQIQRIIFLLTLLLLFLCLEEASGWPWSRKGDAALPIPDAPEELYTALTDMEGKKWDQAMVGFWTFLGDKQGHEDGYALAQLGLAQSAWALGLKQLATEYYADIVRASMDPVNTLQALDGLERITREDIYDERTIVEEILYEKEFGILPEGLNNFVHYYQALMDFRNGYPRWASNHVEKIQGQDDYVHRAKILEALWAVKEDQLDVCHRLLKEVADDPAVETRVRNEAKKALARVLYEQGAFAESYRLYREIEAPEITLADVILEEAWAKYREGDYRKAMGLLVAFHAPSFQRLFKPEQYLLKTLIYMQFCHYGAAQDALGSFQNRYGEIMTCIRQREDLIQNPHARPILQSLPPVERIEAQLAELDREEAALEKLEVSEAFLEEVRPIYVLKKKEVNRRGERVWKREAERLKKTLFDYQEQANLLTYESGMHQYQKVKQMYYGTDLETQGGNQENVPKFSKQTYFAFEGEYWSDELDDYTFFIEDYCETPEKWSGQQVVEKQDE